MKLIGLIALLGAGALVASGCSSEPVEPAAVQESSAIPGPDSTGDIGGHIAVGGTAGLQLLKPTGETVAVLASDRARVTQPTWSRSGDRVVATVIGGGVPSQTLVVGQDGDEPVSTDVRRPYFFYSWNDAGSRIAALGPGPRGTSLDVLDADGVPLSSVSLDSGSLYLAWEPDGGDLLVHTDGDLSLVTDVDDLSLLASLGSPGQGFLAPAWIPGTREALIVVEEAERGQLVRIDVDSGAQSDLGPVDGSAGIVVSPDGSRALVAHSSGDSGGTTFASFTGQVQAADVTGATEIVDLATGERERISRSPSIWAEWSPDGSAIVLLQPSGSELEWFVWSEQGLRGLGQFLPSPEFLQSYVFFSWQYVETPRVWAPDGRAIAYAATQDGVSGIFVHRLADDAPVRIADGDVAFWSPG